MQTSDRVSLAIFPFEDLSHQQELGVFCRSFSDDLITELSRFRQLRVVRLPVEVLPEPSQNLFETFKIGYFVKGAFRNENETIRVNVQLYNSHANHLVWGNRLEGKLTGLSDMQENLLRSIVSALQQQIDFDLLSKLKQRPRVEFTAYEHWLYGMEELKKGSLEADLKAREHFEKALQIQPDYALACSGMSLSYFNEWTCQLWDRWDLSKSCAYEWAQKAIELDEQSHIVTLILGRIFLYEGSYETAEYYFRKSLMLNPNDPDTLFQIALYFVHLGLSEESLEIYDRAMQLNPFFAGNHARLGGVIYFELGDYEKAVSFIKHPPGRNAKIADTDAYCAAIYYYLKDYEKMQEYWQAFLNEYRRLIAKGADFDPQDAINWILKLNPHRNQTNLEEFLRFISNGRFEDYPLQKPSSRKEISGDNYFRKEGSTWKFFFDGCQVDAPEVKGFHDIQKLLLQPRQVFHCAELMGSALDGKGEKLIDDKARKQYQKKILQLQSEIQDAEKHSNFLQLEKLQDEYDQLIDYLSQSLGLKGKSRQTGSTVEKARSAVTWRIRNAIARIEQYHPTLGAHLSNAVKTGTLCSYKPDRNIKWHN